MEPEYNWKILTGAFHFKPKEYERLKFLEFRGFRAFGTRDLPETFWLMVQMVDDCAKTLDEQLFWEQMVR
jgi:hypothetical protein